MRKLLWISLAVLAMGVTTGCSDNTYGFCVDTLDCSDTADLCFDVAIGPAGTRGNFCSRECTSDFQCDSSFGFEGACYSLERTGALCYQTCFDNFDCYSSSVCIDVVLPGGALDSICVPDN